MQTHVVTGAAGFIGSHLVRRLLERGDRVVGVDTLTAGYDPSLQRARIEDLGEHDRFDLRTLDVADQAAMTALAQDVDGVDTIVHLAARAGVRASVEEPRSFVRSNVVGFMEVLELARRVEVPHLLYASSSSVYGGLEKVPFTPQDPVGHPVSVYAATKRADELLAHSYAHLHGVPSTGLRFFTVYGPWGRPDMAYWKFAQALLAGEPIPVFGDGSAVRDLTFVDDIVQALVRLLDQPPGADPTWSAADPDPARAAAPFAVHNIGHGDQVSVLDMIELLAAELDVEPEVEHLPPRPGDVPRTWSDTTSLVDVVGAAPATPVAEGFARFAAWFRPWFEDHGPVS